MSTVVVRAVVDSRVGISLGRRRGLTDIRVEQECTEDQDRDDDEQRFVPAALMAECDPAGPEVGLQ